MAHVPKKPNDQDAHSHHHAVLHERVLQGQGLLVPGDGIAISTNADGQYKIAATGRAISQPASQEWQTIVPFTIYQFANNLDIAIYSTGAGYSVNDVLTVSGGTGTPQTLIVAAVGSGGEVFAAVTQTAGSYTVAPTYPANTTGGSGSGCQVVQPTSSDDWRTFQMRDGIIGWRPRYPNFFDPGGVPDGTLNQFGTQGNSEWYLPVYNDGFSEGYQSNPDSGQPVETSSGYGSRVVPMGTTVQIAGYDAGGASLQWGQIMLDDVWGGSNEARLRMYLFLWVEIIDSATQGFYANLWARFQMIDTGDATTWFNFPNGKNIIPIGIALPHFIFPSGQIGGGAVPNFVAGYLNGYNDETRYIPYQIGNLINQHQDSPSSPNQGVSGGYSTTGFGTNYVGNWSADSLSGQLFYPGDMIIDDSATVPVVDDPPTITINSYRVYVYKFVSTTPYDGFAIETDPPATTTTPERWQVVGTVFP